MIINREKIEHYFKCLKSRTNDPFDWIDKNILSVKEFNFLDNAFDELWLVNQGLCSESFKEETLSRITSFFQDNETYEMFVSMVIEANEKKKFTRKTKTQYVLSFFGFIFTNKVFLILLVIVLIMLITMIIK